MLYVETDSGDLIRRHLVVIQWYNFMDKYHLFYTKYFVTQNDARTSFDDSI